MKWIKSRYSLINESVTNTNNVVRDLCVSMLLVNNNFLDKILDQGQKARYVENSMVFITDLKNLLMSKNRVHLGDVMDDGRYVINDEGSSISDIFSNLRSNFDIEKDYSTLVRSRNIFRNILDKLGVFYDLKSDNIESVLWLGSSNVKEDVAINLKSGESLGLSFSNISSSKTKSFNRILDMIIGEENSNKLYSEYENRWDKLAQEWVRIIYENSIPEIQKTITKYINPDRVYSVTYNEYLNYKHTDSRYKFLGEYVKELDKNVLMLSDLLDSIFKKGEELIIDFENVKNEWLDIKKTILNSSIIEHLITRSIEEVIDLDSSRDENEYILLNDKMKNRFIKLIIDTFNMEERPIEYISVNEYIHIPSIQWFRDNIEELNVRLDYHPELTLNIEDGINDIPQISLIVDLGTEHLFSMLIKPKFTGGEVGGKLSSKIEVNFSDNFNNLTKQK